MFTLSCLSQVFQNGDLCLPNSPHMSTSPPIHSWCGCSWQITNYPWVHHSCHPRVGSFLRLYQLSNIWVSSYLHHINSNQKHLVSINATDLLLQIIITWMSGAKGVCYLTWEFRKIPWEFSGLCKGAGERRKRKDNSVRTRECQYTNRRYAPAWHRASGTTQFMWMTDSCIHRDQWLFEESNWGCFPRLKVWRGTQPCSCTIHLGQVVMVVNIVCNSHSIPCGSWHN